MMYSHTHAHLFLMYIWTDVLKTNTHDKVYTTTDDKMQTVSVLPRDTLIPPIKSSSTILNMPIAIGFYRIKNNGTTKNTPSCTRNASKTATVNFQGVSNKKNTSSMKCLSQRLVCVCAYPPVKRYMWTVGWYNWVGWEGVHKTPRTSEKVVWTSDGVNRNINRLDRDRNETYTSYTAQGGYWPTIHTQQTYTHTQ
jgi:hypothetical protein